MNENQEIQEKEKSLNPLPTFEKAVFTLSWLANINAGLVDQKDSLQNRATTNLNAALDNAYIKNSALRQIQFNSFPRGLAWGPVSVSGKTEIPGIQEVDEFRVTDNLLYVYKGTRRIYKHPEFRLDPTDYRLYVVAVAGTNPDSYNGWFNEDFKPDEMTNWPVIGNTTCAASTGNEPATGRVSVGFCRGLNNIWSQTSNGQTVLSYLQSEVDQHQGETIYIAVAGHSLGGALSPMLAVALKENLKNAGDVTVMAYPSAGPTPGDSKFAKHIISTLGADNYKPIVNEYDVVPRGYNNLSTLCKIYADSKFSNAKVDKTTGTGIQPNPLINGIVTYALNLPAGNEYAEAKPDRKTFEGNVLNLSAEMTAGLTAVAGDILDPSKVTNLVESGIFTLFKQDLINIGTQYNQKKHKTGYTLNQEDIEDLLAFFVQAGFQHTTAYLQHMYFGGDGVYLTIYFLNNYMKHGKSIFAEVAELNIFENFIGRAASYLTKTDAKDIVWPDC